MLIFKIIWWACPKKQLVRIYKDLNLRKMFFCVLMDNFSCLYIDTNVIKYKYMTIINILEGDEGNTTVLSPKYYYFCPFPAFRVLLKIKDVNFRN